MRFDILFQGLIQEKIGSEANLSQNSTIFNQILHKIRDLKTKIPKIKNYKIIFHIRSVANEFSWKCLNNFTKLHSFTGKKNIKKKKKKN